MTKLMWCLVTVVLIAALSACAATPHPVKIADSDQDGILDRFDRCPHSRSGIPVDSRGCASDSDNDGVFDYQDDCPGSPSGEPVAVNGCPIDEDGDGIADSRDRCLQTPRGVAVDADGCPRKLVETPAPRPTPVVKPPRQLELQVTFRTGRAVLEQEFAAEFDQGAKFIRSCRGCSVTIEGHTDNVGPAGYNRKLSLQRAEVVRDALVARLGQELEINVVGYGEEHPLASNDTQDGRLRNRRVLISINEN